MGLSLQLRLRPMFRLFWLSPGSLLKNVEKYLEILSYLAGLPPCRLPGLGMCGKGSSGDVQKCLETGKWKESPEDVHQSHPKCEQSQLQQILDIFLPPWVSKKSPRFVGVNFLTCWPPTLPTYSSPTPSYPKCESSPLQQIVDIFFIMDVQRKSTICWSTLAYMSISQEHKRLQSHDRLQKDEQSLLQQIGDFFPHLWCPTKIDDLLGWLV